MNYPYYYNPYQNMQMNGFNGGYNNNQQVTNQQPVVQQQITDDRQWVQSDSAAEAFIVMAGNTVVLWNSNEPTIYIKTTGLDGKPLPIQKYKLVSDNGNKPHENNGITDRIDDIDKRLVRIEKSLKKPKKGGKLDEPTDE